MKIYASSADKTSKRLKDVRCLKFFLKRNDTVFIFFMLYPATQLFDFSSTYVIEYIYCQVIPFSHEDSFSTSIR